MMHLVDGSENDERDDLVDGWMRQLGEQKRVFLEDVFEEDVKGRDGAVKILGKKDANAKAKEKGKEKVSAGDENVQGDLKKMKKNLTKDFDTRVESMKEEMLEMVEEMVASRVEEKLGPIREEVESLRNRVIDLEYREHDRENLVHNALMGLGPTAPPPTAPQAPPPPPPLRRSTRANK